ncbi:MAG: succinyl-diaminopimelate desuccinylase [Pseudomonadota bacterium]
MSDDTLTLLKKLLCEASLTPYAANTFQLIENLLTPLGFTLEYMNAGGVTNLWATHGSGKPLTCFAGHLDVVPTGPVEEWTSDPFNPTIRDGYLYGRGAADMKTSVAAMLVAAQSFVRNHPNHSGTLAFLLTSDEEGPATHGTRHVIETLQQRNITIDYCLIGEPTSEHRLGDTIKHGRRGSLTGKLKIYGTQGHIAYPHLADNPIHRFTPALQELTHTIWDTGDDFFQPTQWQISNIHAGTGAANVIPGVMDITFNFRHAPISSAENLKTRFTAILDCYQLKYDIVWGKSYPFLSERGPFTDHVIAAVQTITGIKPKLSTHGGTSDGRFISWICKHILELGPVNESMHKINECVRLDDIEPLRGIYELILESVINN